jgi:hypothetical protein
MCQLTKQKIWVKGIQTHLTRDLDWYEELEEQN